MNRSRRQTGVTFPSCAKCAVYSFLRINAELNAIIYFWGLVKRQESRRWRAREDIPKTEGNSLLFLRGEGRN